MASSAATHNHYAALFFNTPNQMSQPKTKPNPNDWIQFVDWSKSDAEIGRMVGLCRFRISQIRIEETGITKRGKLITPPPGFIPERTAANTAKKYEVENHVARRWHKMLGLTRRIGDMPEGFEPVLKIHQQATAAKYSVSVTTVIPWIKQFQAKEGAFK